MTLTKEFIQKRIKEQNVYIAEKKEQGISLLSGYNEGMIDPEEFYNKMDRLDSIIDSAIMQKTYFEVLLIQKNNGN